jgi:hypothetical protein
MTHFLERIPVVKRRMPFPNWNAPVHGFQYCVQVAEGRTPLTPVVHENCVLYLEDYPVCRSFRKIFVAGTKCQYIDAGRAMMLVEMEDFAFLLFSGKIYFVKESFMI